MKLIPMVDYNLMPIIQKLSVAELNVYSSSTLRILERDYTKNYAKLLNSKIEIEMFIGSSKIFDGWVSKAVINQMGTIILYNGGNELIFRKDFGGRWFKSDGKTELNTVEDLIDYDLTLSQNGINKIRTRI